MPLQAPCQNSGVAVLFRRLNERLDKFDATLDRVNETIERNNQAFERNNQAFERNNQAFERNNQAFDRNTAAFEDLQVVIRESRVREERAFRSFEAKLEEFGAIIRAQTDAMWKLLERWGEGPTPGS